MVYNWVNLAITKFDRKKSIYTFCGHIEVSRTHECRRERECKKWQRKHKKVVELQFVVARVVLSLRDNSLKCSLCERRKRQWHLALRSIDTVMRCVHTCM